MERNITEPFLKKLLSFSEDKRKKLALILITSCITSLSDQEIKQVVKSIHER
tara:strand:+ start:1191 stop:1346 length:156 start_codon:yes stop_codon:yes gene_type:complete